MPQVRWWMSFLGKGLMGWIVSRNGLMLSDQGGTKCWHSWNGNLSIVIYLYSDGPVQFILCVTEVIMSLIQET